MIYVYFPAKALRVAGIGRRWSAKRIPRSENGEIKLTANLDVVGAFPRTIFLSLPISSASPESITSLADVVMHLPYS